MNILFAADGSEASDAVIEAVVKWFPKDAALYGITVIGETFLMAPSWPLSPGPYPVPASSEEMHKAVRDKADEIMTGALKKIEKLGREVKEYFTPTGNPAAEIIKHAHQVKADVVVLGTRNVVGTAGWILGSTAQKVAHYAPCSVLVVKKEADGGKKHA